MEVAGYGETNDNYAQPGTQTSGYKFGIGQDGQGAGGGNDGVPGAGGGYYGGISNSSAERAAGGSSFVSGNENCNAIAENSTEDVIVHTNQPNHYSGKVFTNSKTFSGSELMPSASGLKEITGRTGNGLVKITKVK